MKNGIDIIISPFERKIRGSPKPILTFVAEYTDVAENTIMKIQNIFVAQPSALTAYFIRLSSLFTIGG